MNEALLPDASDVQARTDGRIWQCDIFWLRFVAAA
jgi:hypothetical protein